MKFYIGGMWNDKPHIQQCIAALRSMGHILTHDWTTYEADPTNKLANCAVRDIDGVRQADVVIAIMNDSKYAYRGTFTELGCALALNKHIIIVCGHQDAYCRTNCFFHHPDIAHVDTFEQCISLL